MVSQRVVAINDFGLERRDRTTSTGTASRFTVTMKADPVVHVFDPKVLGAGPSLAIAEHLRARVGGIGALAAPSTQLQRKYAATAAAAGKPWASRRYSGGRTGALPPNQSSRLFSDSGRFAQGIVAGATPTGWVVNVAANRLDPSTFKDGEAGVNRMFLLLRQHVPEFGDASQLLTVPAVRGAIGDSLDAIFLKGLGRRYGDNRDFRAAVRQARLEALKMGLDLLQTVGGL